MKSFFQSLAISFSMYSRFPMPQVEWDEKNRRFVICFFPLVGAVIGGLTVALFLVCDYLSFPSGVTALLLMALPLLLTGGIHADGFLDTSDARSAFRSKEERLRILKDPHVGAFGVIRFALYLLVLFAAVWLYLSGEGQSPWIMALTFVLSRTLSGLSVVTFPCANKAGTLYAFSGETVKLRVRIIMVLEVMIAVLLLLLASPITGALMVGASLLLFLWYFWVSKKEFGGITGDLAGWFLCMSELFSVIVAALSGWIGGLL